jgi:hypothetical protein
VYHCNDYTFAHSVGTQAARPRARQTRIQCPHEGAVRACFVNPVFSTRKFLMDLLKFAQIGAIALVAAASLTACQRRDETTTGASDPATSSTAGTSTSGTGSTGGTVGTQGSAGGGTAGTTGGATGTSSSGTGMSSADSAASAASR